MLAAPYNTHYPHQQCTFALVVRLVNQRLSIRLRWVQWDVATFEQRQIRPENVTCANMKCSIIRGQAHTTGKLKLCDLSDVWLITLKVHLPQCSTFSSAHNHTEQHTQPQ
jgi:hypothetical protein